MLVYIEDAVSQLLDHKDDSARINSIRYFGE